MPETKQWYMALVVNDWLTDAQVSLLREATRGIWMDALCCMFLQDRCGQIVGTIEDLARLCRTTSNAMRAAVDDLHKRNAADVTEENGVVTLRNRRMYREWIARKSSRERKQRSRANRGDADVTDDVTPLSQGSIKSHSHSKPKKESPPPPVSKMPLVPLTLQTGDFMRAWDEWQAHRREIKHPLTPRAAEMQLRDCEQWGEARAIAAIHNSIGGSYQKLVEPYAKGAVNGRPQNRRAQSDRGEFAEDLAL